MLSIKPLITKRGEIERLCPAGDEGNCRQQLTATEVVSIGKLGIGLVVCESFPCAQPAINLNREQRSEVDA